MANALGDLGEVVSDQTVVLNLLCGLNDRNAAIALHLRRGRPFPSFLDARTDLLMEEFNLANRLSVPSFVLVAAATGGPSCVPQ